MKNNKKINSVLSSGLVLGAFLVGTFAPVSMAFADTQPATVNVIISGYVDGQMATAQSASSTSFQMNATWNATNIGAGSGQYNLAVGGMAPDNVDYQAKTVDMTSGANYGTNEVLDGTIVGATCAATGTVPAYALTGYSTGATMADAIAAVPTTTAPDFTNLTSNEYVIVWNTTCGTTVTTPGMVNVIVSGYVDGQMATAQSANNSSFQMNAGWNATNIGTGTGQYNLAVGGYAPDNVDYQAKTADMTSGANYNTNEVMDGTIVGATCAATGTTPAYSLVGYSSGATMADAIAAAATTTAPSFTNMTGNEYVIVWNKTCGGSNSTGTISGSVNGGVAPGALAVTSVTAVNSTATADGTFTNGWKYTFNITVPENESHLSMKFANWLDAADGGNIPAANNIRISSAQADNSGATVLLTGADTYSSPSLNITGDMDPATPGKQVQVTVEVAVPTNSVNGSYTTNFGVQTLP